MLKKCIPAYSRTEVVSSFNNMYEFNEIDEHFILPHRFE